MVIHAIVSAERLAKWRTYWPLAIGAGGGALIVFTVSACVAWAWYRQSHQLIQLEQQYQRISQQVQHQQAEIKWWKNHQSAWQILGNKGWFEDRREGLLKQLTTLSANEALGIQNFHLSTAYPVIKQVAPQVDLWASRLTIVAGMQQEEQGFVLLTALEKLDPLAKLVSCEWQRSPQTGAATSKALTLSCELEKYFFVAKHSA